MERLPLSQQILDYYYKFGRNRDLEKYLRLRGSCYKSPSEGSVNTNPTSDQNEDSFGKIVTAKSLDSLHFEKKKTVKDSGKCPKESLVVDPGVEVKVSQTNVENENEFPSSERAASTNINNDIKRKDKGKKSYSFCCESNISINFPFQTSNNEPNPTVSISQKEDKLVGTDDSSNLEEVKLDKSNCSSNENEGFRSAIIGTKTDKRLEWDSLGDVGYDKSPRRRKRQNTITSLEKSVLREFFANQGIELSFPIHEEVTQFSEESHEKLEILQPQLKKSSREKWREVLENVKKKYIKSESKTEVNLNQNSFIRTVPRTHSTPNDKTADKCSQTSFLQVPYENKEVQVDIIKNLLTLSTTGEDSAVSPSSFEYIRVMPQVDYSENSDKENQMPHPQCLDNQSEMKEKNQNSATSSSNNSSHKNSDVNLGVKLICSLIEAKSLNEKQKKLLAKKIITKIAKKNPTSSNGKTSSSTVQSNSSSIKSSHRSTVEGANVSSVQTLKTTSSSMEKGQTGDVSSLEHNIIKKGSESAVSSNSKKNSSASSSSKESNINKNANINKIEAQDEGIKDNPLKSNFDLNDKAHLLNNWLGNVTKSEIEYAQRKTASRQGSVPEIDWRAGGDCKAANQNPSHVARYLELERVSHINWIENEIKHLENLKNLLITDKEFKTDFVPKEPQRTIVYPVRKDIDPNIYDKVASMTSKSDSKSKSSEDDSKAVELQQIESKTEVINPKRNYTRTVRRTTNEIFYDKVGPSTSGEVEKGEHRFKITTYTLDEEQRFPKKNYKLDKSVVRQKTKKSDRSKLETPNNSREESTPQFTNGSSESNHYSELRDVNALRKQQNKTGTYMSSAPSSNFSSESISLPTVSNSTTTTTTHQYDRQVGIGVQTSDSLLKTNPIFGPVLNCGCKNICKCKCMPPTIREYRPNKNKQAQVKPSAVAYIINFERKKSEVFKENNFNEHITLQDCLKENRPDFNARVNERQEILNEMKHLRQSRQKKIDDIIENASESSVSRRLNELPPPPTKHIRIFKTKEMKAMTKRHCHKLSEVVAKKEREKIERKKRNSRILMNVFNKRLQRRVHEGKLSLEHSGTVI